MNTVSIWILILAVIFFVWVIVPYMLRTPIHARMIAVPETSEPSPQHKEELQKELEKQESAASLKTFYTPARPDVPEDFPISPVGTCPLSKPEVSALPIVDVPRCMMVAAK